MKKFQPDDNYTTIAVYSLIVLLWTALCVLICLNTGNIISGLGAIINVLKPLIYGFLMALAFNGILKFFETRVFVFTGKKKARARLKKALSLAATYVLVLAVIVSLVAIVMPQVSRSYMDLQQKMTSYIYAAQDYIDNLLSGLPVINIRFKSPSAGIVPAPPILTESGAVPTLLFSHISQAAESEMFRELRAQYKNSVNFDIVATLNNIIMNSYEFLTGLTPHIFNSVMGVMTEVKNIVIGLVISAYYLAAQEAIRKKIKYTADVFLPAELSEKLYGAAALINKTFIQFLNGKLIDAAIIGVVCTIIMSIFRMPYAPLVGLLVGVTNIIPYIGPFLGAVPGAFIIFIADPPKVIWFVILIVALQQLDSYVIEPSVLRGQISLDAVWIIISVVVMGGFFGLVGLLMGVPLFAVIYVSFKQYVEKRLAERNLPTETSSWMHTRGDGDAGDAQTL